jgi:cytochrome P450
MSSRPLSPPAAQSLYFNAEQGAWLLSRYRDVLAALRSGDLSQARPPRSADGPNTKPERTNSCFATANGWTHSKASSALANAQISKRQMEVDELALAALERLPNDRPVDLVSQFIRPWCLASAIVLTGIDPDGAGRLAQLLNDLSASDAAPHNDDLRSRAKEANKELDRFFLPPNAPYGKSMFLGLAQTVPYFLASAWAVLLQHPVERNTLQAHPDLMPRAVEELLRYAGPVHSVFRRADRETVISGKRIIAGGRLILQVASANRDRRQFADPAMLDFRRGGTGHLALSSGSHYCVGASFVRMMTMTATQALLARYPKSELSGPVVWSWGTMLSWASALPVSLRGVSAEPKYLLDAEYSTERSSYGSLKGT